MLKGTLARTCNNQLSTLGAINYFRNGVFASVGTNRKFSTTQTTNDAPKSTSFIMNMFVGKCDVSQIMPFPRSLNQDQLDMVEALIDPFTKFMTEVNDPAKNDANAEI